MANKPKKAVNVTEVEFSNLDKVFYPKTGFTKGEVILYYSKISDVLLLYLKQRPITMKRFPDGVNGLFFYEKQRPSHAPKWIKSSKVARADGTKIDYCLVNDLRSLLWMANIANLEFHTFLHQVPNLSRPTAIAFDLDPGAPADIIDCCKVALKLKDLFDSLKLKSYPKTSGSKGLQIYIPINSACSYKKTKDFSHTVAMALERHDPKLVVSKMQKHLRKGKVLIDWSQNDEHKTTACAYTLRAKDEPFVSTPVTWAEIFAAVAKKKPSLLDFDSEAVLKRVKKLGDIFSPVLTLKQKLPALKIEL